jgi:Zn-dependent peptidase ImmA (M78 family)
MSEKQKNYNVFWFSFFHEIGHILLHGKKDIFLENIEYDDKVLTRENEANEFATKIICE